MSEDNLGKKGHSALPFENPLAESSAITRRLRAFYDSVQDEGIPDRFLDLLEKLDQAEAMAAQGPSNGEHS